MPAPKVPTVNQMREAMRVIYHNIAEGMPTIMDESGKCWTPI